MKIIIDEMPQNPKQCLFGKRDCEYGIICSLNNGFKVCKSTNKCEALITYSQFLFPTFDKK